MNNFEDFINSYIDTLRECKIKDAMTYSLDGGKRFRPRVIFALAKGMGLEESKAYSAALALELIQTYSLIHDDLPAMDNDDMRRGKPSSHKAYGEDIAILTGDELLTDSFRVVTEADYDAQTKVNIINALSKYAGLDGMIYGQLLDVTTNASTINSDKLFEIQDNKTGGLFKIACLIPMYISKRTNEKYFIKLGSMIGQIFQNQDDLFDLIKSEDEMGKKKSDIANDKGSALAIYSVEELTNLIDSEFKQLDEYLELADFDTSYIKELLLQLKQR